ncbi:MAG: 23S rRNA (adenine(2503)-C(2))-methyltransferase RlmN [Kiritimatiellaeota bacterium]|nr:23S rRNA (adenine(2503)-C(2))-methyltransferase RlmN [Kiritimatiellota bacterium]
MLSIYDSDKVELFCRKNGIYDHALKRFRIAYFKKGLPLEDCLATLTEEGRAQFTEHIALHRLALAERHDSQLDGASKVIFVTADMERVEAVILRIDSGRTSLCISSQIGCSADCAFCATGKMGLTRNLTTAELLDQVVLARRLLAAEGRQLRNVVIMGMGEPFHNEKAVCAALECLRDARGFYFSERHLLVSTIGLPAVMLRFVERYPNIRLALSLHAARPEVRARLMPHGGAHALEKIRALLPALSQHGNFMIEYLELRGVNDGPADLAALIEFLRGIKAHINLIQFNPFPGSPFEPVTPAARDEFARALRAVGFKVTLRHSLGADIAAACGQLAGTKPINKENAT